MCGIVGYVGYREVVPLLVDGLKRLEYRGYDSAGVVVVDDGRLATVKTEGKLDRLRELLEKEPLHGSYGLGHTRWATHGPPSHRNAHPIHDSRGRVALIHNGIVENFLPLKRRLLAAGWTFSSDTDTEVLANLISSYLDEHGPGVGGAQDLRRGRGHVRLRLHLQGRRPPGDRAGAPGAAAPDRHRRPGELPGLRSGRGALLHPPGGLPRERRPRPAAGRRLPDLGQRRRAGRAAGAAARLGRRADRKGRLQTLHAQGDPRAVAGPAGHPGRPGRLRERARSVFDRIALSAEPSCRGSSTSTCWPAAPPGTPPWSANSCSRS